MAQYEIRDGKRVLKRRTAVPPIVRDTIKRRAPRPEGRRER
ncbi:MAG: hypothetical protein M5U09_18950 [Gammaproteobacteria bacterium]|nr:hypothetical protein [Gammaproteobacteria bacterium]